MSNKRKKQKLTPWSLGSLPTTPVTIKNPDYETDKELKARLRREEEQAKRQADPIYIAEQMMNKTMSALDRQARQFWGQSLEAIIPKLYSELSKDCALSVPAIRSEFTLTDVKAAFDIWFEQTLPKTGDDFANELAAQKFVRYLLAQAKHGHDVSNPAAVAACWERCLGMGTFFAEGDLTYDRSKAPRPVAAPASKPKISDIETIPTESTEGRRKALAIVNELAETDAANIFNQWLDSLAQNFNFRPDDKAIKEICNWFIRNAKPWLSPRSYDEARRWAVSAYVFPENLLTPDEALSKSLEAGPALATLGYDERTRLYNKIQRQRKVDQAN